MDGSVRHLEAAMTRHLPQDGSQCGQGSCINNLGLSVVTGGIGSNSTSIGSLNSGLVPLNSSIGAIPGGFSAIQWAGHVTSSTKRETVIKTSRDPLEMSNPPCSTPGDNSILIASLPSSGSGIMPPSSVYGGYHISPPASVSPDRLKAMTCDPYSEQYNPPLYANNGINQKNSYDSLRW